MVNLVLTSRARRRAVLTVALGMIVCSGLVPSTALAHEAGALDRSFAGDGAKYIDFSKIDVADEVFLDEAGLLTVVGAIDRPRPWKLALTRLLPGGSFDRSFGRTGKTVVRPTAEGGLPLGWDTTTSQKIVVLIVGPEWDRHYLMRLNADGSRDGSFGNRGLAHVRLPRNTVRADLLALPSGRLVVAARVLNKGAVLLGYKASGALDASFGESGSVKLSMDDSGQLLYSDERIFFGGVLGSRLVVYALSSDGQRIESFGVGGRASVTPPARKSESAGPPSLAVTRDGHVLVAAEVFDEDGFASDFVVASLGRNGELVRSFPGRGWRRVDVGKIDAPDVIVPLPNGKFVVVGTVSAGLFGERGFSGAFLYGFERDGTTWDRFGNRGLVKTGFGKTTLVQDAKLTDRGIVVVGTARNDFLVARYRL